MDGFPRTVAAGRGGGPHPRRAGARVDHVALLEVDEQELVQRLLGRAAKEGRSDDNLAVHPAAPARSTTSRRRPLIAYYERQGVVRRVPGMGDDRRHPGSGCGRPSAGVITVKSPRELGPDGARRAHRRRARSPWSRAQPRAGVSTADLDAVAEEFIRSHDGATPSFKGLYGFPATLCTSINDEVVHGIPSKKRVLQDGRHRQRGRRRLRRRLARRQRRHGPGGRGLARGAQRCSSTTQEALGGGDRGGARRRTTSATSATPCSRWPKAAGYSVVRELVGHGIGTPVPRGAAGPELRLAAPAAPACVAGMTIAIEPMINLGRPRDPHPGRPVDGGDGGRIAVGPLRAHRAS